MVADGIGLKNGDDFWISGLPRPGPKSPKVAGPLTANGDRRRIGAAVCSFLSQSLTSVAKRVFGDSSPNSLLSFMVCWATVATPCRFPRVRPVCKSRRVGHLFFLSQDGTKWTKLATVAQGSVVAWFVRCERLTRGLPKREFIHPYSIKLGGHFL